METQTAVATPSVAQESTAPNLEIPRSGTSEYAEWRMSGKLPEKKEAPKPQAESAPADTGKDQAPDDAADSAATQEQEHKERNRRRPDVEARIKALTDERDAIRKQLEEYQKATKTQADPSPAKPAEKPQPQYTRPKPTVDAMDENGKTKYSTYEDYVEDLADWKAEQRIASQQREQAAQAQARELQQKVDEAKSRYPDFDEVIQPTLQTLMKEVPQDLLRRINKSKVLPDFLYTISPDLNKFIQMAKNDPEEARDYIVITESLIREQLSGNAQSTQRNEKGQFVKEQAAPAKRGPESAPPPPIEIGNRGVGNADETARALQAIERGDPKAVREWLKADRDKEIRRRRGM